MVQPKDPCSLKFNLAFRAGCLSSHREEALIWSSEIAPVSIPRGAVQPDLTAKNKEKVLQIVLAPVLNKQLLIVALLG